MLLFVYAAPHLACSVIKVCSYLHSLLQLESIKRQPSSPAVPARSKEEKRPKMRSYVGMYLSLISDLVPVMELEGNCGDYVGFFLVSLYLHYHIDSIIT